jgi:prepilin-type N-terminal cleavage/methylation domain-containing protein
MKTRSFLGLRIRRSPGANRRRRTTATAMRDGGFTLPELLVAVMVSGILVSVMATAISVMLRTTPQAELRLAESKDITFLQTWLPVDLSSAIGSYDDPTLGPVGPNAADDVVVKAALAANDPFVSYNADLPGTNVLTLVIPDLDSGGYQIISYRYLQLGGDWRLVRYRILSPGEAGESVSPVGVAQEITDPPPGWSEGQAPTHAFQITSRNQVVLRPIGENVTVHFVSGNEFSTGGAGLSAEKDLTPNDPVTLPDPTAPPTRCGGNVALVLDTSWSVPANNGGAHLESAATSFIRSFQGTPTYLTVLGFDAIAYQLAPNLNGVRGQYISLLNPSAAIETAVSSIQSLPNVDTASPQSPSSQYYGNGNAAVGWTQKRTDENGTQVPWVGGTNWEDALHAPFFDINGAQRSQVPETVIFVTDGDPNKSRSDFFGGPAPTSNVAAAATAANNGRATGARVIGVLIGNYQSSWETNLADVVGTNKWNGSVNPDGSINLGNAVAADYFTGAFSQLGDVLRSIMAAQCGGTVTIQKETSSGPPAAGIWNYSTVTGDSTLDLSKTSSITFDYVFATGEATRDIVIHEEARAGFTFSHAECSIAGVAVPPGDLIQSPDGAPGVGLTIKPDQAVSCTMVSDPE